MDFLKNVSKMTFPVFVWMFLANWQLYAQISNEPQTLLPNQPLEGEMIGAETHRYKIDLKENQFFQVRVEQKGIDVVLKLSDAADAPLAEIDSPNGNRGFEVLSFINSKAGVYLISVVKLEANTPKGNYSIFLETPRTATEKDVKFLQAKKEFSEAQALLSQRTLESFQKAREKFIKCSIYFQEIGDKNGEAESFLFAGFVSASLGEKLKALDYYNKALPLFREISDKRQEVITLNNIGRIYDEIGEKRKALEIFNQTLPLFRAIGDKVGESITHNNLGLVYSGLGENEKALEYYKTALPMIRGLGDKNTEAILLNNIGKIYDDLGEKKQALDYYTQALEIFQALGNKGSEALILNNIAGIYESLGEKKRALDYYFQALSILQAIGNKKDEASILTNLALVYAELYERKKSLEYLNKALPLFRLAGDKSGEAHTLNTIGKITSESGDELNALEFYEQASILFRASENKVGLAGAINNIGVTYYVIGNKPKAIEYFNQALMLLRETRNKRGEARLLGNIGLAYSILGQNQKALEYFNEALGVARAIGYKADESLMLHNLMYEWSGMKNKRIAIFYGKQAVNIIQELRQFLQGLDKDLQTLFLENNKSTFRKLADLLIEEGKFAQAEQVLLMLKEEEFADFLRRDSDEIKTLDKRVSLDEKEKSVLAEYNLLAEKVSQIGREFYQLDEKKRQLSGKNLTLLPVEQKRYEELEQKLIIANKAFDIFLRKELVKEIGTQRKKEVEIQFSKQEELRKLGNGTVTLYTVVSENRYRVILTTPKVQIDGKYEIKAEKLNEKIFNFRKALKNPWLDPRPLGKELYDILLKPIEKELQAAGAKTLIWSLDGTLRHIPLSALSPDGKRYLIEDYQNVTITAATGLNIAKPDKDWRALGFGVSTKQTVALPTNLDTKLTFDELPGTKRELFAIVKDEDSVSENGILPGRRFLDNEFTADVLKDRLTMQTEEGKQKYNVVHIASHFRLGNNKYNSFLLLGKGQVLTLDELKGSNIRFGDVDLVALSACNTAFAEETNGEEIDSLAEVIQNQGGKSILATLWAVADESTSLLMSEFYRLRNENPNLTKSEILQMVQKQMIEGKLKSADFKNSDGSSKNEINAPPFPFDKDKPFAHPYYWSPFVLIGNWR